MQEEEKPSNPNSEQPDPATPPIKHGECCDECRRTCKRNFWTEVLRTIVKIGTAVMAAFGLSGFVEERP